MTQRIEYMPHGILVYGPLPISTFAVFATAFEGIGCTTMDTQIAHHYGALLSAPFPGHRLAWRAELGLDSAGVPEIALIAFDEHGQIVKKKRGKK